MKENRFIEDSGSIDLIVRDKSMFFSYNEVKSEVSNPNGEESSVKGIGDVKIVLKKGKEYKVFLQKVLQVPEYKANLLSVSKVGENGHKVIFGKHSSVLKLRNEEEFKL